MTTPHQRKTSAIAIARALLAWFGKEARDLPWRRTRDPYAIWVSEIMLQQTQVATVIPYWERWMKAFPDVASLAAAAPDRVLKLWEGLGYYSRARHLHQAARQIHRDNRGVLPNDFAGWLALPGVGRYTAGAICSIAFNQPTPIVDGNVMRVLTRLRGIRTDPRKNETNRLLWQWAEQLVRAAAQCHKPKGRQCGHLNQALMELGAVICTPRQPDCPRCPLCAMCAACARGQTGRIPPPRKPPLTKIKAIWCFVIEAAGKFLVRQRPAGGVNARLWEFPNAEVRPGRQAKPEDVAFEILGFRPRRLVEAGQIRFQITHHQYVMQVYRGRMSPSKTDGRKGSGAWLQPSELGHLAFAAAHRKVIGRGLIH